jgi:GT2 family glycosyltransferase
MAESDVSVQEALRNQTKVNVSVIVPVWNGLSHLNRLFDSLDRQTYRASEVIVVDNGSSDGVAEAAERRGARVVRFAENRGFAAAVNRGVAESGGELLALLNSDVELAPDWTARLRKCIVEHQAWFACGLIMRAANPEVIDGSWDLVSRAGMPWRAGSGYPASSLDFQGERPVAMASFTAILLRRALWDQVGPLDEAFESYLEDVDFGLRCVRAGLKGWYTVGAHCTHQGSATLGRWHSESVRRISRNQLFLIGKHLGWERNRWNLLVGQALWGLLAFQHGAGRAWCQGKWEGWRAQGQFVSQPIDRMVIADQEREILALQAKYGFDSYWRWYRRLTEAE